MIQVDWKGGMLFQALSDSGQSFTMDSYAEPGGVSQGVTPMEALLASTAACGAMDVVSILEKKRQPLTSYRIEIEGERPPAGEWPRPYTSIRIRHIVTGVDIDPAAVARAVELSDEKYCSVMATLRFGPKIETSWRID